VLAPCPIARRASAEHLSLSLSFSLLTICSPPREIREGKNAGKTKQKNKGRGIRRTFCDKDLVKFDIPETLNCFNRFT